MSDYPACEYPRIEDFFEDTPPSKSNGYNPGISEQRETASGSEFLDAFIARHGLKVQRVLPYQGGLKLPLAECPFDPQHTKGSAAFFVGAVGTLGFRCQHDSCTGKTWHDVRALLEPNGPSRSSEKQQQSSSNEKLMPRVMTFEELLELKVEPAKPLIENVLPTRGGFLIVGASKSGKTILATQIGIAVATGKSLFGWYKVMEPGPVMIVEQDDTAGVESIKHTVILSPDARGGRIPLYSVDKVPYTLGPQLTSFLESEIKAKHLKLVVLDSYTALRASRRTGSDIVKDEQADLTELDELGKRTNSLLLILHHASKGSANLDWSEQGGGTFGMNMAVEGILHLSRFRDLPSNANERLIRVRARHGAGVEFVLRFQSQTMNYEHVIEGPASPSYPVFLKIENEFGEEPFSPKLFASETGMAIATVHRHLDALWTGGVLKRIARGQYALVKGQVR